MKNIQDKPPNFYTNEGKFYLVRCYKCGYENYALCVALGECAWCGDQVAPEIREGNYECEDHYE